MKQIKLYFVNYDDTVNHFNEDQGEFHKRCFEKLLHNYRIDSFIPISIKVPEGDLFFIEAPRIGEHIVCKYYFKRDE